MKATLKKLKNLIENEAQKILDIMEARELQFEEKSENLQTLLDLIEELNLEIEEIEEI